MATIMQDMCDSEQKRLPEDASKLSKISFPRRPRKLGHIQYVHFGTETDGRYLPCSDFSKEKDCEKGCNSVPLTNARPTSTDATLAQHKLFSPGDDYACTFITGDVGELRKILIDGIMKEVLVIPQGKMRADANSSNFGGCNMPHPLSDSDKMLEAMVLTMFQSGFATPYFRGKGFADIGNDMALTEPEFSTSFVAGTWDFFGLPSYQLQNKLGLKPKKVIASPLAVPGHRLFTYKIASIYQTRIYDRQTLLKTERAKAHCTPGDVVYFLQNGMLCDAVCQNIAFTVAGGSAVKLIFVEGSEGNHFFEGKTERTAYNVVALLKPLGITAVKVRTPEEFALQAGYENKTGLSGRDLTYATLRNKIDGMLALGTFKGIEQCECLLPEQGELMRFAWKTEAAVKTVQDLLWRTVYGIKGGTVLTQDQQYCTMFDVADLESGIVKVLDLHGRHLEDVIYTA
ncbi:hypothetical protein HY772_06550 [Candidatus Woesearchaeota archaeon]|nr:hypothetical protein [Candidatus Woesearchaeota archaeon]